MVARKVTVNRAVPLTITLDEADRAELDRIAKEQDRSLAHVARQAIRDYIKKIHGPAGEAA